MRTILVILCLLAPLAMPGAAAVLPHYERGFAELTHTFEAAGGATCTAKGIFVFDTRAGSFAGDTDCGTVVEQFGCANGDTGWHHCGNDHATLIVEDVGSDGLLPGVDVTYRRVHPDGTIERALGSGSSVPSGV